MPLYRYKALDLNGNTLCGTMDAGTAAEARANLRDKGLHTTKMEPAMASLAVQAGNDSVGPVQNFNWHRMSGRSLDLLSEFSRHLALLLKSGLPLAQSLSILSEQLEDRRFQEAVQDLAVRVREGASMDEALAAHPKYFPELYVCISRAGAASGNLPYLLSELSSYYTRQKKLRDRIISALTYPALMGTIGLVVLIFLMAFVVPKVTGVLLEQHSVLPWPTEVLLWVSHFLQEWWWALLAAVGFMGWLLSLALRTPAGLLRADALRLAFPVLGDLYRKQSIARWADTMSNLLSSGIPVLQSLSIVKGALGNRVLAESICKLEQAVTDGMDLSDAMKNLTILPKSIGFVVGVGEESGDLAKVLRDVAESYNQEVEVVATRLTDLLNPILIVFLGLVVGFIVAAILLPITDFSQVQ